MFNIKIDTNYRIDNINGVQDKFLFNNSYYKIDKTGSEGITEELSSLILLFLKDRRTLYDGKILKDEFNELIKHGYSSVEIIQMLTKYENASGLDLINCNHVVEETLSR